MRRRERVESTLERLWNAGDTILVLAVGGVMVFAVLRMIWQLLYLIGWLIG